MSQNSGVDIKSPDPSKYHVTATGTIIPHCDKGLDMSGFTIEPTAVNIIDMSAPTGAALVGTVDMTKLSEQMIRKVSKELGTSADAQDILKALSAANLSEKQSSQLPPPADDVSKAQTAPWTRPTGWPKPPTNVNYNPTLVTPQPPPLPNKNIEPAPTVELVDLGVPWLASSPTRPRRQVIFNLGPFGQLSAYYHDVVDSGLVLALVFDTRAESFNQYLPPSLDEPITIVVPDLRKSFLVATLDCVFRWGCFEFCVLIVREREELE